MPSNIQGVYDDEHNRRRLTPNMYRVESSTQLEAPSATGENPSTDVPQNRWRYSLKPAFPHRSGADLTADPVVIKLADTVSDLEEVFGFNIYEIQNDDQTIFGMLEPRFQRGSRCSRSLMARSSLRTSARRGAIWRNVRAGGVLLFLVAESIRGCAMRTPRVCCCSPPTGGPTAGGLSVSENETRFGMSAATLPTCRSSTRRRPPARLHIKRNLAAFRR